MYSICCRAHEQNISAIHTLKKAFSFRSSVSSPTEPLSSIASNTNYECEYVLYVRV